MTSSHDSNPDRRLFGPAVRWVAEIILGVIVGCVLTIIVTDLVLYAQAKSVFTTVNGWSTTMKVGKPGNSFLLQALMADELPAANIAEESVYWITGKDSTGRELDGQHAYILHFPPGGLPPNDAFWSVTITDAKKVLVANPINRYSVGDRSGLAASAGGSIDIYIQNVAPTGRETNWLPAPAGRFILWLRVYQPGQNILDGKYHVPPVVEVK